jgi:AraC-like DNA-binding protein
MGSFSTAAAPVGERANLFRRTMAESFRVGLDVQPSSSSPLLVDVIGYRGRRLQYASLRFSPHTTRSVASSEHGGRLLLSFQKQGELDVAQGSRERRVKPGQLFVLDLSQPFTIETGTMAATSVYLPLAAVRQLVPHLDAVTALPISAADGAAAVLRAMVDELMAVVSSLTEQAADCVADSIPHLLSSVLNPLDEARRDLPSTLRAAHRQRIRGFARDHLGDSALDIQRIAEGVRLSPRYIHSLFADEPATLMKWIWRERLDRCHRELADPAFRERAIGEIAYGWGFNDLAHFSRAFRERFGCSPRQLRRQAN